MDYFIRIAKIVAEKSGCTRRKVGAVFVRDGRILATGYNQAPSGVAHCDEVGCTIVDGHCVRALHAELNGILNAARAGQSLLNSKAYVTTEPCVRCLGSMRNAGVTHVYYDENYRNAIPNNAERNLWGEINKAGCVVCKLKE
jgi:dCMP deaminase